MQRVQYGVCTSRRNRVTNYIFPDDYLLSYKSVQSHAPASSRQIRNVLNWFSRTTNRSREEAFFIDNADDMISIEHRPRSLAQVLAERLSLDWCFTTSASTSETRRYDATSITRLKAFGAALFSSSLLITSTWAIFYVHDFASRLALITGLVALSWALMSVVTTWRSARIIATGAA